MYQSGLEHSSQSTVSRQSRAGNGHSAVFSPCALRAAVVSSSCGSTCSWNSRGLAQRKAALTEKDGGAVQGVPGASHSGRADVFLVL